MPKEISRDRPCRWDMGVARPADLEWVGRLASSGNLAGLFLTAKGQEVTAPITSSDVRPFSVALR
jgi:hypothetical protein